MRVPTAEPVPEIDSKRRVFGLDVLRALAILVVVQQHSFVSLPLPFTDGVDLFFVLSGFLIGQILIKAYRSNAAYGFDVIGVFWARRWFRTLPNYVLAFLLNVALFVLYYKHRFSEVPVSYLVFVQNVFSPFTEHIFFSESWSLAIEEWFYLLAPLAILAMSRIRALRERQLAIPAAIGVILIASLAFRIARAAVVNDTSLQTWNDAFRCVVVMRLDAIGYGVLAAYLKLQRPERWNSIRFQNATLAIGLLMCALFDRTWVRSGAIPAGFFAQTFYFSLHSIGVMLCLPKLDGWRTQSTGLAVTSVRHISKISYSMYLFHNSLFAIPMRQISRDWPSAQRFALYVTYWVLVVGLSSLVYKFFEEPILKYRDRRYRDPSDANFLHASRPVYQDMVG